MTVQSPGEAATLDRAASEVLVRVTAGLPPHERWQRRWARRGLTLPLFAALWAVSVALAPAILAVLVLADCVSPSGPSWRRSRSYLFMLLYLTCEVAGIVASAATWLCSGVWAGASRARLLRLDVGLQRIWSACLFRGAMRIFSVRVNIEGAAAAAHGPYLLLARHASTADTILCAGLIANRYRMFLRYVLKRELLWDPCLDIVGNRLPNVFVERSGAATASDVAAIRALARSLGPTDGVLIYPEGTRFSQAKLRAARERLREQENDGPALYQHALAMTHVLPPRAGGALALLEAAPNTDVVLMAHTGFEGAASFADFWNGELVGTSLRVRIWRVPAAELPGERAARVRWLYDVWSEIDRWIAKQKTADRPSEAV